MNIKRYRLENKVVWDQFVKASSSLFFFQRDFMDYHQDRFQDHSLMIYREQELVAILPASQMGAILNCHGGLTYGYLVSPNHRYSVYASMWQEIQKYCLESGINEVVYKKPPFFFSKNDDSDVYELLRKGALINKADLTSYVDYSDYVYSKGRKSSITKSLKQNLNLDFNSSKFSEFYNILTDVLERNHETKPVHSLSELLLLKQRYPDNIVLCVVEQSHQLVAGALLFIFDQVVHTQYLCVTEFGKNLCAMDFLLHTLIEKTKQKYKGLSFGISTEDGGKKINTGLILQKESYGSKNYLVNTYKIDWRIARD